MVLGFVMFCIASVFLLNTAGAFGLVSEEETAPWNIIMGGLVLAVVIIGIAEQMFQEGTFWWAAQVILFAMTYLMLGVNTIRKTDGRGLGWFCLFVAVTVIVPASQTFAAGDMRLGILWVVWGIVWFLFFIMLGLQKPIGKFVRWIQVATLFTLWVPALMILTGNW